MFQISFKHKDRGKIEKKVGGSHSWWQLTVGIGEKLNSWAVKIVELVNSVL